MFLQKHNIPISAIPCYQYRKALEWEGQTQGNSAEQPSQCPVAAPPSDSTNAIGKTAFISSKHMSVHQLFIFFQLPSHQLPYQNLISNLLNLPLNLMPHNPQNLLLKIPPPPKMVLVKLRELLRPLLPCPPSSKAALWRLPKLWKRRTISVSLSSTLNSEL